MTIKPLKHLIPVVLILTAFNTSGQQYDSTSNPNNLLDSINTYLPFDCLFLGHGSEPSELESLRINLLDLAHHIPLSELSDFRNSDNVCRQIYSLIIMSNSHPDAITNVDTMIFSNTDLACAYTDDSTTRELPITYGKMARDIFSSNIESSRLFALKPKVEKCISDFIKSYAMYPDSYEMIAFDSYSISINEPEEREPSENDNELTAMEDAMFSRDNSIEIQHEYKLTNIYGEAVTVIHYFLFVENDGTLVINNISDHELVSMSGFYNNLDLWMSAFGRKLKTKEKEVLGMRIE